jgi:hypothetical protein
MAAPFALDTETQWRQSQSNLDRRMLALIEKRAYSSCPCNVVKIMRNHPFLLVALLALVCGTVHAEDLKPGLWEITSRTPGAHPGVVADMREHLAKMSPEQRKQIEKVMTERGMVLDEDVVTKICLTRKDVQSNLPPMNLVGHCTYQYGARGRPVLMFRFTCTHPKSKGEGEYAFMSESFKSNYSLTTQGEEPKKKEIIGKFMSADCGNVRPASKVE